MFDDDETGRFIRKAHRALKSHRGELRWSPAPDDVRAAMDVTIYQLRGIAESHPDRRTEVEGIVAEFQSSAAVSGK